MKHRLQKRA